MAAGIVELGPLRIDLIRARVHVGPRSIEPQYVQMRLLAYLIVNAGKLVTSDELCAEVLHILPSKQNSVARHVCVLRGLMGSSKDLLITLRGGYMRRVDQSKPSR